MWRNVLFVGTKKKCVNITSGLDSFRWKIEIDLKATIVQSFICLLRGDINLVFDFFELVAKSYHDSLHYHRNLSRFLQMQEDKLHENETGRGRIYQNLSSVVVF
jgi:hypothetical protein